MDAAVALQYALQDRVPFAMDFSRPELSPFVKWAGGKANLLSRLLPLVPGRFSNYYEPFLGGGALFLSICGRSTRFRAFLTDTNRELVNAYKIVKSKPEDLIRALSILRKKYRAASNKENHYYKIRSLEPTDPVDSAARFIFLNKTCYNGLYRVNPKGEFNVPFGHHVSPRIFDEDNIRGVSKALRETRADLRAIDYRRATESCRLGDFVYLDPPYHPSSKTSSFTDYTPGGFSEENQRELSKVFAELTRLGCVVVLSNSDTSLVRRLYYGYDQKSIHVNRPISCIGTGRKGFRDLIVFGRQETEDELGRVHPHDSTGRLF